MAYRADGRSRWDVEVGMDGLTFLGGENVIRRIWRIYLPGNRILEWEISEYQKEMDQTMPIWWTKDDLTQIEEGTRF